MMLVTVVSLLLSVDLGCLALTRLCLPLTVKITGKLQDGTVFTKKGHDEEPFKFKTDEGKNNILFFGE